MLPLDGPDPCQEGVGSDEGLLPFIACASPWRPPVRGCPAVADTVSGVEPRAELGPCDLVSSLWRLVAGPLCCLLDCGGNARQLQARQQHGSDRSWIEAQFPGVGWKGFGAFQSDCQMQLLVKMFDNPIHLL